MSPSTCTRAGTVVERYDYGDFGQPSFYEEDGDPRTVSYYDNPYLFNGRRWDPETDLYYYRTRYLDPVAGRFASRDTIGLWGDTANLGNGQTYVGNNPWTRLDPYGLQGGYIMGSEPEWMKESERHWQNLLGITPPTTEEKLNMTNRAARVIRTGVVVGLNTLAWGFSGPLGGVPVTGTTLGLAGTTSYYNRQAQYVEATGEELGKRDTAFIISGDLTGASAAYTMATGEDPLTGEEVSTGDRLEAGAHLAVGLAAAQAGARAGTALRPKPTPLTGELHHAVSKPVHKALQRHPNLKGLYKYRDPRFAARAKDPSSHRGYERWHRDLCAEKVEWIQTNRVATPTDFEAFLKARYAKPDLQERFPEGLGGVE